MFFDPAGERGEEMNRKLLGTNTIDRAKLSDLLLGYQVVAGLDYRIGARVTLGFKLRWAGFGRFDDESEYDSPARPCVRGRQSAGACYVLCKDGGHRVPGFQPRHEVPLLTGRRRPVIGGAF